ncbi:MAG TPA: helix-turn-helix domain-containing protein [Mycobacterium sp.]
MTAPRPYATLLAKGEDRKQRILDVAQRLLARNGWRNTTLAQIAKDAGVTSAGLLHHFDSKEQLLHAVLDARDTDDAEHAYQQTGDLAEAIASAAERFYRSPELVGTFAVLMAENIAADAPLHDRLVARYRAAVEIIAERIRFGQSEGRYRQDMNPVIKAVEILAFVNGMETSWLLDPTIPLTDVFKEYSRSLASQLAPVAGS